MTGLAEVVRNEKLRTVYSNFVPGVTETSLSRKLEEPRYQKKVEHFNVFFINVDIDCGWGVEPFFFSHTQKREKSREFFQFK